MSGKIQITVFALLLFVSCNERESKSLDSAEQDLASRWSVEQAQAWGINTPWLRGANFNPSTAINQLEMWQAETFDPQTIDRELGWAAGIGLNCMRVYLHHVAWEADKLGFKISMA